MKTGLKIILASSSPYRRELLQRLDIDFETASPDIDETPLPGEPAETLVLRLARSKAEKIGEHEPDALVIGSDQVACLGTGILTKPGNRENAVTQLQTMRGQTLTFLTGLCLFNTSTRLCLTDCVPFAVTFRQYTDDEIHRYLDHDAPYDCAGSFKSEKMGITLVSRMAGDDPAALQGLPLIRLSEMFRSQGLQLP
jgi:MAF protein